MVVCNKQGETSMDVHKSPRIVVSMPEELLAKLREFSAETGMGMSAVVRMATSLFLAKHKEVYTDTDEKNKEEQLWQEVLRS